MLSRWIAAVFTALFVACAAPAAAQDGADGAAIEGTIRSQLEAFKADDGAAAYAYAAPNIKRIFPTADAFMAMVRQAYQPVYRPQSYSFGRLEAKDGMLTQRVEIVGPEGDYWTALYSLERQPDGSWRITGCRLVKSEGSNA